MAEVSSGSFNTGNYEGRYLTFSWSVTSQNIANNTTTISWSLKGAGGSSTWYYTQNIKVKIAGETVYNHSIDDGQIKLGNGTAVASGTYILTHNSTGKKSFSAYAEAGIYVWTVNCTGSGSWDLPTIPRLSTLSTVNGTLGTAQTLTVTRQATSFTHTITYKCGSATGTIVTKSSSTSISWTPPLSLASQNTVGTTVYIVLSITTYSGSTTVGTNTKTITCSIPSSVKPSCSVTVTEVTDYSSVFGNPIKGISKLSVSVAPTLAYGSQIASYNTMANGSKYTTSSFTTEAIKQSGTITITSTVTDNRGRSGSNSTTVNVLDYSPPTISKFTIGRCDQDGTANDQGGYCKVTFSYSVTPLSNNNTASCKLLYKKTSSSSYTSTSVSTSYSATNKTYIFSADSGSSYDIQLSLTDYFSNITRSTSLSTAFTLMNWRSDGTGMAIGKVSEKPNAFECSLPSYFGSTINSGDIESSGSIVSGGDITSNGNVSASSVSVTNGITANGITVNSSNVVINSKTLKVFVTEYGTSNGWYYRKYSDGTCDLWCNKTITGVNITGALGNWYRSSGITPNSYPFKVYNEVINSDFHTSNSNGALVWNYGVTASNVNRKPSSVYLIRPTSVSGVNGTLCIHVHGTY